MRCGGRNAQRARPLDRDGACTAARRTFRLAAAAKERDDFRRHALTSGPTSPSHRASPIHRPNPIHGASPTRVQGPTRQDDANPNHGASPIHVESPIHAESPTRGESPNLYATRRRRA
jgi:hypothetical protein